MKLPKSLTTVTTFSKILAVLMFFALLFGAFYAGLIVQVKNYENNYMRIEQVENIIQASSKEKSATCDNELYEFLNTFTTFNNGTFSFQHPYYYVVESSNTNEISWKTVNPVPILGTSQRMKLRSSKTPFPQPTQYPGAAESIFGFETEKLEIDGVPAAIYTVNCGADCYYKQLEFAKSGAYYQLYFDVAGGGLDTTFQNLVNSIKFAN